MLRKVVSHPDFAYAKSGCLLFKAAGCFVLHKVYRALHPMSLMLVRSVLPAGAGEGGASGRGGRDTKKGAVSNGTPGSGITSSYVAGATVCRAEFPAYSITPSAQE